MKESNCDGCPFFWEVHYPDDADCGCNLDCDWKPKHKSYYIVCHLPIVLRKLAANLLRVQDEYRYRRYERKQKVIKRETKETLKALMADMERIEPNTEDGENIKRTCICMVLEYMEGEE